MARIQFAKYLWHLKRLGVYLGAPGLIGLALIISCAAFYAHGVAPAEKESNATRQQVEILRAQLRQQTADQKRELTPTEQLSSFYKNFPPPRSASNWIGKIYDAAKAQNLSLEQGEYRLTREGKLSRYEIILPLKGTYSQIHAFVNQTLTEVPNAALDGINFQRQKVGETSVQSQVKFTLFLGEGE